MASDSCSLSRDHRSISKTQVLRYLDDYILYHPNSAFMDLENGYFHTANSRLSLFADCRDWAIVFQKFGYFNRGFRIMLDLEFFGSRLHNLEPYGAYNQLADNKKFLTLVQSQSLQEIEIDFKEIDPMQSK